MHNKPFKNYFKPSFNPFQTNLKHRSEYIL
jgi:hypothetical protein